MAKQTINIGTGFNTKDGDTVRDAFNKVNQNFDELYAGDALNLSAVNQHILPATTDTYDLGSPTKKWRSLYLTGSTVYFDGVPLRVTSDGTLYINDEVAATPGGAPTWTSVTGKPSMFDIGGNVIGIASSTTVSEETTDGTISETTTIESQIEIEDSSIVITKRITQVFDDTVVTTTNSTGSQLEVTDARASVKHYAEPDGPDNSGYFQFRADNSGAIVEGIQENVGSNTVGRITVTQGVVSITTSVDGADKEWMFDFGGDLYVPTGSFIRGSNDLSLVSSDDGNSGVFVNGNSLVGTAVLYATNNAIITADYDGNRKDWNFDKSGTITVPLLLPKMFTAVLDEAHMIVPVTLAAEPWQYGVAFAVNPNGSVETQMDDPTPTVDPGYVQGSVFRFTEEDHGIPGYTFDITLNFTFDEEAGVFVTNPSATPPPEYPATIESTGAIKLTSNDNSWVFGTDARLTVPGSIIATDGKVETAYLDIPYGGEVGVAQLSETYYLNVGGDVGNGVRIYSDSGTVDWLFKPDGTATFPGLLHLNYNNNEVGFIDTTEAGISIGGALNKVVAIQTDSDPDNELGQNVWIFASTGTLSLPPGGGLTAQSGGIPIILDQVNWAFDSVGQLNQSSSLYPKAFTAVLDIEHLVNAGGVTLVGDFWQFPVSFVAEANGDVTIDITNNVPFVSNPGYTNGLQFSFTEADHGIPGYIFQMVLDNITNVPAGWTVNLLPGDEPSYPSTLASVNGPLKLTAVEQSWVFGIDRSLTLPGDGVELKVGGEIAPSELHLTLPGTGGGSGPLLFRFTDEVGEGAIRFPNGTYTNGNQISAPTDDTIELKTFYRTTVSAEAISGSSQDLLVVDISANDDITVLDANWEINAGSEVAPQWLPVVSTDIVPGDTCTIGVPGFEFIAGFTYTFRNSNPAVYDWTFNATGTLTAPGGAILSSETENLGAGEFYRDFAIELPSTDGLNEFRWEFDNSGDMIAPGAITIAGTLNTPLGSVVGIAIDTDNYVGLQGDTNAGVIIRATDDELNFIDWKFGTDGGLTFPDATVQTTAWAGGRVVSVPGTSVGATGDKAGDMAFDGSYIYYCTADYTGTPTTVSWSSVGDFTGGGEHYIMAEIADPSQLNGILTVTNIMTNGVLSASELVTSYALVLDSTYKFYLAVTVEPWNTLSTSTLTVMPNIWRRVAWSGDTW